MDTGLPNFSWPPAGVMKEQLKYIGPMKREHKTVNLEGRKLRLTNRYFQAPSFN